MVHLGNNIARLRGFRRIPQKDIASKLNLTQQDYSKLEAKAEIDDNLLERIAHAIDFPIELIKELENSSIQTIHNSGSITDSIFYQNNPIEKIIELYELRIKDKDVMLQEKSDMLKQKDEIIELFKKLQQIS
jgi:transcriptional regulator with XRE-family HTH domain